MIKLIIWNIYFFLFKISVFATAPWVNCKWLPWCDSNEQASNGLAIDQVNPTLFISNIIWKTIQYVAVFSVIVLMIAWVYFLVSIWEEEKIKKAKKMVIYSVVWVIIANSAWLIINLLNRFTIN